VAVPSEVGIPNPHCFETTVRDVRIDVSEYAELTAAPSRVADLGVDVNDAYLTRSRFAGLPVFDWAARSLGGGA
jgi:hypothetical protein